MKKILYVLLVMLAMVTMGCEDWLEVNPGSEVKSEQLFNDESGFKDALTGVYVNLTSSELYGQYLSWQIIENQAQQYDLGSNSYYTKLQTYNFEDVNAQNVIESIWLKQYNVISNINNLLINLEEKGEILDPTVFNLIKGEALALRAYCHFDLIRLYGKGDLENRAEVLSELTIPYVTNHSKELTEQLTYAETFQLIEKDIAEALELLKSDPYYTEDIKRPDNYDQLMEDPFFAANYRKGRETRMNYGAVKAFQARVYLWEGKINEAQVVSEETIAIIQEYIDRDRNAWATESWGVGYPSDVYRDQVFYFEQLFCLDVYKLGDYLQDFYPSYVGGSSNSDRLIIKDDIIQEIFSIGSGEGLSDLRYTNQLKKEGNNGWLTIKIDKTDQTAYFSNVIPMLKISEVYLIAAECYIKGNEVNLGKSIEYLNLLKEKRNIPDEFNVPADADIETIKDAIFMEYRKDFIQEGQLYYFYKRLGYKSFPGVGNIEMSDEQYVFPYPDIEIDLGNRN